MLNDAQHAASTAKVFLLVWGLIEQHINNILAIWGPFY